MKTLISCIVKKGDEIVEQYYDVVDIIDSITIRGEILDTGLPLKHLPKNLLKIKSSRSGEYWIIFNHIYREHLNIYLLTDDHEREEIVEPQKFKSKTTAKIIVSTRKDDLVFEINIVPKHYKPVIGDLIHYYWGLFEKNYLIEIPIDPDRIINELKKLSIDKRILDGLLEKTSLNKMIVMNIILVAALKNDRELLDIIIKKFSVKFGESKIEGIIDDILIGIEGLCNEACRSYNTGSLKSIVEAVYLLKNLKSKLHVTVEKKYNRFDLLVSLIIPLLTVIVYVYDQTIFYSLYLPLITLVLILLLTLSSIETIRKHALHQRYSILYSIVDYLRRRGDLLLILIFIVSLGLPIIVDLSLTGFQLSNTGLNIGVKHVYLPFILATIVLALSIITYVVKLDELGFINENALFRLIYRKTLLFMLIILATTIYYVMFISELFTIILYILLIMLMVIILIRVHKIFTRRGLQYKLVDPETIISYCILSRIKGLLDKTKKLNNIDNFKLINKYLEELDQYYGVVPVYIKQYIKEWSITIDQRNKNRILEKIIEYIDDELKSLKKKLKLGGSICGI
ncbi:MAG: hypothetical protein B6U89_07175 [Desulfurococcales archaeon ex4484_58]|nr:MAG: hypothetical protein B6U89_07175 [Desulfurococcales archaeon ex4484_58]